jgi:hypothetical protein
MSSTDRVTDPSPTRPAPPPAANAFSISMMVSGVRCMLTYIVFPWALPVLGLAAGVGSAIGLAFGVLAIGSNVLSIRRMWATDFKWKWPISVINAGVIVLLLVLIGLDLANLT